MFGLMSNMSSHAWKVYFIYYPAMHTPLLFEEDFDEEGIQVQNSNSTFDWVHFFCSSAKVGYNELSPSLTLFLFPWSGFQAFLPRAEKKIKEKGGKGKYIAFRSSLVPFLSELHFPSSSSSFSLFSFFLTNCTNRNLVFISTLFSSLSLAQQLASMDEQLTTGVSGEEPSWHSSSSSNNAYSKTESIWNSWTIRNNFPPLSSYLLSELGLDIQVSSSSLLPFLFPFFFCIIFKWQDS